MPIEEPTFKQSGRPSLPPLRLGVTILCSLILALIAAAAVLSPADSSKVSLIEEPGRALERVAGRGLDVLEALPTMPWWVVPASRVTMLSRESLLERAIPDFRELLGQEKHATLEARAMLALLLMETGQSDAGRQELAAVNPDAMTMNSEWARDRLDVHATEERGVAMSDEEARRRSAERGRRILWRWAVFEWSQLLVFAVGIVGLLVWGRRRCPDIVLADGVMAAPWTIGRGYAVMVRGVVLSFALFLLGMLVLPAAGVGSLTYIIGGACLLWLARKHLFQPWERTLGDGLGLKVRRKHWRLLLLTTLSLVVVNQVAGYLASLVAVSLEYTVHWTDVVDERLILGGWGAAFLVSLDAILWAPLFEEIGFRGILFPTLNRKLGTISAALLSSVIFGAIHLYSFPGFLVVTLSGFFYALAYTRTGSLLPGMAAHAMNNLLIVSWSMVGYR